MAYLGIGYSGSDDTLLASIVEKNSDWLDGDRQPKFYGSGFIVLYDSNTAREFVKKCFAEAPAQTISVFSMSSSLETASTQL